MQIGPDGYFHLTYCTNIHPADGWSAVEANLRRIAPGLKARLSPSRPFGLGLRLSAREARELLDGNRLAMFRSFLDESGLYVAIINGFPYGPFHGAAVKRRAYAPDWQDQARLDYTLDLIEILRALVPAGLDGGISTSPLSYKAWVPPDHRAAWEAMTRNIARVAEALVHVRRDHGAFIHLDIEPEPDCLLETSDETIDFFERWLLPVGGPHLAKSLGVDADQARRHLLDHIRVCFDCCHVAVEHENPRDALERLDRAGIAIGRVQLSSALEVSLPADPGTSTALTERLRPFADATYLHQVVERRGDTLRHYPDLDVALDETATPDARQWRIHFHVPLFTSAYHGLGSTQDVVRAVLEHALKTRFTRHLEIETYTWDVLPPELKADVSESIAREYAWVLETIGELEAGPSGPARDGGPEGPPSIRRTDMS